MIFKKKIFFLFLAIVLTLIQNSYCQELRDPFKFNKLIIKAEIAANFGRYAWASKLFNDARVYAPSNYIFPLKYSLYFARFTNSFDSCKHYLKIAFKHGYSSTHVQRDFKNKPIIKTEEWKDLNKELEKIEKLESITFRQQKKILFFDSLSTLDKKARNSNRSGNKTTVVDSLNLNRLMKFIKVNGFPIYPEISNSNEFETLLLHLTMYDWPQSKELLDSIIVLSRNNKFDYRTLMLIIDKKVMERGKKKQIFGTFFDPATKQIYPLENPKTVDKIRREYNIPSLYEDCLLFGLKPPPGYSVSIALKKELEELLSSYDIPN